jgi:hypothetical protein
VHDHKCRSRLVDGVAHLSFANLRTCRRTRGSDGTGRSSSTQAGSWDAWNVAIALARYGVVSEESDRQRDARFPRKAGPARWTPTCTPGNGSRAGRPSVLAARDAGTGSLAEGGHRGCIPPEQPSRPLFERGSCGVKGAISHKGRLSRWWSGAATSATWRTGASVVSGLLPIVAISQSVPWCLVTESGPVARPGPGEGSCRDASSHVQVRSARWLVVVGFGAADWCPDSLRVQLTGLIDLAAVRRDASGVNPAHPPQQRWRLARAPIAPAPRCRWIGNANRFRCATTTTGLPWVRGVRRGGRG